MSTFDLHSARLPATLAIDGPLLGEKETSLLWREVHNVAHAMGTQIDPINPVREFFGKAHSHTIAVATRVPQALTLL